MGIVKLSQQQPTCVPFLLNKHHNEQQRQSSDCTRPNLLRKSPLVEKEVKEECFKGPRVRTYVHIMLQFYGEKPPWCLTGFLS